GKALHKTGPIHRHCVEHNPQRTKPEMPIGELSRMQLCFEDAWNQPVDDPEGEETIPPQRTYVHVCNRPIGKVADSIYIFKTQHRSFKRSHTIGGNRHYEKFQHYIFAHFIPSTTQG